MSRSSVLVLASALLFGTTGTARALGPDASPAAVGAARIAIGGVVLVGMALAHGLLGDIRRWPRAWVGVAGAGVAGYQVCFFSAVAETGVAVGTIVAIGSAPAVTGGLAWALRGERPDRRWAPATALAVAGAALLVGSGAGIGVDAGGVALALGAGGWYALYTVASKQLLDGGGDPTGVMAAAFGLGALLLAPLLALGDTGWLGSTGGLALALYLGLAPTALAYVLFARGLERLDPATVATLTLAEPTATALGVSVLGERPSALAAVGALLVLSGLMALVVRPSRPAAA